MSGTNFLGFFPKVTSEKEFTTIEIVFYRDVTL